MEQKKILLVEDNKEALDLLENKIKGMGYSVDSVLSCQRALKLLLTNKYDLIISDFKMPKMNGKEFFLEVNDVYPNIPFIVQTGYMELIDKDVLLTLGVREVFTKPFDFMQIEQTIKNIFNNPNWHKNSPYQLDNLYMGVSVDVIQMGTFDDYCRYIRLGENNYKKIAKAGQQSTPEIYNKHIEKGIEFIYLLKDDLEVRSIIKDIKYLKSFEELCAIEEKEKAKEEAKKKVEAPPPEKVEEKRHKEEIDYVPREIVVDRSQVSTDDNELILSNLEEKDIDSEFVMHAYVFIERTLYTVKTVKQIKTLFKLLTEKYEYPHAHAIATAIVSAFIAKELGISTSQNLINIALGGFLHDIGKIKIDKSITEKPLMERNLEEHETMKTHTTLGYEILKNTRCIPEIILNIVSQHHENCMGNGYPHKLKAARISQGAKIVSLANTFCNTVVTNNIHEHASVIKTIELLRKKKHRYFDPDALIALSKIFRGF